MLVVAQGGRTREITDGACKCNFLCDRCSPERRNSRGEILN